MTSEEHKVFDNTPNRSRRCSRGFGSGWGKRGNWSGFNIAAMVVGFVFFWPIGLVILYWIIKGNDVRTLPAAVREKWTIFSGGSRSGNVIFEEYQQTQYDRIREIKEEIRERGHRFANFREDAQRRADQEEFNRFMASSPASNGQ